MAGNVYSRNIRRTILGSMGRYIAILAIIALGVGFFAGVKDTKGSMMLTCDRYVNNHKMYDLRLLSTYGFTEDDVKAVYDADGVEAAEGSVTADFFSVDRKGNSIILRAHSITELINTLDLVEGRMPKAADECVADPHFFTSGDIGTKIKVTDENDEETWDALAYDEYTIVGLANTPYYLMKTERGTTSLGDGKVKAFIYAPEEAFTSEYYTELFVTSKERGFIFSDEYDSNIEKLEKTVIEAAEQRGEIRFEEIQAEARKEIDDGQKELDDARAELESRKADVYAELSDAKVVLDSRKSALQAGQKELSAQKDSLLSQKKKVTDGIARIDEMLAVLDQNDPENAAAVGELNAQKSQLEASLAQINQGLSQIKQKETELSDAELKIKSGYDTYYKNKAKADSEFASAEKEITDGQAELDESAAELDKLEKTQIYVQDRMDNIGFGSFESNADIVDSIAKVFPVFFFLIAALVCSTTMSRMIEEERTQIGALRALGYSSGKIMLKYMVYSGSAAVIGCIAGFFAGSKYFPYAIWIAYGMMFGFAPLEFYFDWPLALISLAVSLLCSIGTTYFACRGQLKYMPAEIIRPKAPKAGKRIFLERIGFIWSHLKFLHKVSARNIFRYKKRMIMMILGIGGCTALVVAGFGINDSVAGIADHQYTEIEKYDMTVVFSEPLDEAERNDFEDEYGSSIENTALLQQTSVNVRNGDVTKSCTLSISDDDKISRAVRFEKDGEKLSYPETGEALINNKIAEMLKVGTGDEIKINYNDTESVTLKVSGVYRNYVSNYIYINSETYEQVMGEEYEPPMLFVTFDEKTEIRAISKQINEYEGIMGISANEDIRDRVNDMMVSLNYIIILVIGCAGALAFIVLFNLGNINITEREREIATIEVLGFYPKETGAYVFRENLILAMMGIIAGIPAGYFLHKFIMSRIVVDAVAFNEVIEPVSYVYTVLVVLGFTFIVDIILRRKLRKINMAEALKSIE